MISLVSLSLSLSVIFLIRAGNRTIFVFMIYLLYLILPDFSLADI